MYLSTSTSTEDFPEMYLSTFQVLYKLYLSTDVLKYKVLLPGSDANGIAMLHYWFWVKSHSIVEHPTNCVNYAIVSSAIGGVCANS